MCARCTVLLPCDPLPGVAGQAGAPHHAAAAASAAVRRTIEAEVVLLGVALLIQRVSVCRGLNSRWRGGFSIVACGHRTPPRAMQRRCCLHKPLPLAAGMPQAVQPCAMRHDATGCDPKTPRRTVCQRPLQPVAPLAVVVVDLVHGARKDVRVHGCCRCCCCCSLLKRRSLLSPGWDCRVPRRHARAAARFGRARAAQARLLAPLPPGEAAGGSLA